MFTPLFYIALFCLILTGCGSSGADAEPDPAPTYPRRVVFERIDPPPYLTNDVDLTRLDITEPAEYSATFYGGAHVAFEVAVDGSISALLPESAFLVTGSLAGDTLTINRIGYPVRRYKLATVSNG